MIVSFSNPTFVQEDRDFTLVNNIHKHDGNEKGMDYNTRKTRMAIDLV